MKEPKFRGGVHRDPLKDMKKLTMELKTDRRVSHGGSLWICQLQTTDKWNGYYEGNYVSGDHHYRGDVCERQTDALESLMKCFAKHQQT